MATSFILGGDSRIAAASTLGSVLNPETDGEYWELLLTIVGALCEDEKLGAAAKNLKTALEKKN